MFVSFPPKQRTSGHSTGVCCANTTSALQVHVLEQSALSGWISMGWNFFPTTSGNQSLRCGNRLMRPMRIMIIIIIIINVGSALFRDPLWHICRSSVLESRCSRQRDLARPYPGRTATATSALQETDRWGTDAKLQLCAFCCRAGLKP